MKIQYWKSNDKCYIQLIDKTAILISKYAMRHSLSPKIIYRMTTNERGSFPSDNYIDEYLINEKLLGFVYFRRDEHNLCDVFMIDLDTEISNDWYRMDKWFPIEIYTEYK